MKEPRKHTAQPRAKWSFVAFFIVAMCFLTIIESCKKSNKKCTFPKNEAGLTHGMCSCYWDLDKKYLCFVKQFSNGNWINEYVNYGFDGSTVMQYIFLDTNSASVFSRTFEYPKDSVIYSGDNDRFIQLIPQQKQKERLLKIYVANPPFSKYQAFIIYHNQIVDSFRRSNIPFVNKWDIKDSLLEGDSVTFEIHSSEDYTNAKHIERYKSSILEPFIPGFPFKEDHVTPNVSSGRKIDTSDN